MRGWRWVVGSGVHGYWLGSYEQAKSRLFTQGIRPGDVVYDVGANVGYYTLLAASATGPAGRVIAFEPLPGNLQFLRDHIAINHLKQVEVIEAAVSDHAGESFFEVASNRSMGRIATQGTLPVQLVAIDELVATGRIPPPDCMKIDVEGAEAEVLAGARNVLAQSGPDIFLAIHGEEARRGCREVLTGAGYKLIAEEGKSLDDTEDIYATRR